MLKIQLLYKHMNMMILKMFILKLLNQIKKNKKDKLLNRNSIMTNLNLDLLEEIKKSK